MRRLTSFLLAAGLCVACGAAPDKPLNKDEIRNNAEDANADLDRQSSKKADEY